MTRWWNQYTSIPWPDPIASSSVPTFTVRTLTSISQSKPVQINSEATSTSQSTSSPIETPVGGSGKNDTDPVAPGQNELANSITGPVESIPSLRGSWATNAILPIETPVEGSGKSLTGSDERGRVMRRTIMRYVCLCLTMVLTNISPRVKKRFPTIDHLVEAGLLNENEHKIMQDLNEKFPRHSKHWLPIVWAASIVTRARKEGRCRDDFAVKTIIDELNKFRGQCGLLISYDTISVPLVYTQVVTLAVYSFFLTSVMGQQWIETKDVGHGVVVKIDQYFPIFTTLQFFFYMGWLKVAESLINPFGEDDDDFEVNWMVDRNIQVAYLIVDEMHHEHPTLVKDQYWDDVLPIELPHTVASAEYKEEEPQPSTANIEVSRKGAEVIPVIPSSVRVDEMADDNASGIHFSAYDNKPFNRGGPSTASLASVAQQITRVNTVASALKRFFSKDEGGSVGSRPTSATPEAQTGPFRFPGSASSSNLTGRLPDRAQGSIRITDQVIEEVDEQQMTITSMHGKNVDPRPTAASLWEHGPPKASEPMDVPQPAYKRTQSAVAHGGQFEHSGLYPPGGVDSLLSASAPTAGGQFERNFVPLNTSREDANFMDSKDSQKSIGAEDADGPDGDMSEADDFEKLRAAREKERAERQKFKLARSVSGLGPVDPDLLMEKLTKTADGQQHEQGSQTAGPSGADTPDNRRHSGAPGQADTTL
ncbi:bestrophin 2,3,4 [Culex quinquefasciatus]|uniref:Bestrophin homolog n=1 Tax=Culex quinquefasciatus TaxID=7176 RepID=B0XJY8_CULQU|nr:bestrophin 2,3,4 [Culex quinquefasciatus]|eukprot:XP_001869960.1 bestrophin 2,3,4 [Culex quinquefasciatus]